MLEFGFSNKAYFCDVNMKVNNKFISISKAILDTGCSRTCISLETYARYKFKCDKKEALSNIRKKEALLDIRKKVRDKSGGIKDLVTATCADRSNVFALPLVLRDIYLGEVYFKYFFCCIDIADSVDSAADIPTLIGLDVFRSFSEFDVNVNTIKLFNLNVSQYIKCWDYYMNIKPKSKYLRLSEEDWDIIDELVNEEEFIDSDDEFIKGSDFIDCDY